MLKLRRSPLPEALQQDLGARAAAVAAADTLTAEQIEAHWKAFKQADRERGEAGSVFGVLRAMSCGKCAYCEGMRATTIDHHWPKSPHPHNQNRGTPLRMFNWENLVLGCQTCNGWECKASHMEWDAAGRPSLLNPCEPEDDPLCYLEIVSAEDPSFVLGWILPRAGLAGDAQGRAAYTIKRLKLNHRDDLLRGRRKAVRRFHELRDLFDVFGPDFQNPAGHSVRQKWIEFLDPAEPYLAVVRQLLSMDRELHRRLLEEIPELAPELLTWASA